MRVSKKKKPNHFGSASFSSFCGVFTLRFVALRGTCERLAVTSVSLRCSLSTSWFCVLRVLRDAQFHFVLYR
jgi:hypothetical protein